MSQIALSNSERIEVLRRFGYTEREAQFLVLAALHGGFFVRSQYCRFIGRQVGGSAAELIRKLFANEHATAVAGCHNIKVYHLGARPFYAALGQEDNRNRRERPPVVIKNKLMCLDFVLDHPGRYLATEQEKILYFNGTLGIPLAELPCKLFRSPTSAQETARYFVDKYPIFLCDDSNSAPPVVSFSFVDEGLVTDAHFQSYLRQYRPLFHRLAEFRVIYVAASELAFKPARKAFESLFGMPQQEMPTVPNLADRERLLDYFEARRLYEAQQFETFDRAKLLRLRDNRQAFSGAGFDALYQLWSAEGAAAFDRVMARAGAGASKPKAAFETVHLTYNYSLFGSVSRISFREQARTHPTATSMNRVGAIGEPVVVSEGSK